MTLCVLLLFAVGARAAHEVACSSAKPVAFPITDFQVNPAVRDSLIRGIPVKIGTPPQSIAVLPWPELNNTYLYNDRSPVCEPSLIFGTQMCKVRRGNFFLEAKSSSFSKASDLPAAGGATSEITTAGTEDGAKDLVRTSLAGTEQVALGSGNFSEVPIGIVQQRWDNGHTTMHALGLGSNSSYLNALVRAGQIPSRAWSIFWGRMWTTNNADQDGSLVLGGYDSEKVIGRNYTQKLDYDERTGCWTGMRVRVTNLLVNFFNGTDSSVMLGGPMDFCIIPQRQLLLEAPKSLVDAVEAAANLTGQALELSFSFHRFARVYNASSPSRRFDLTFVLESGLQVRVPSDQFDVPHVNWDRNGARVIDRAKREILMNGLEFQDPDQQITLGRYFFTAAYLLVDHDAGTFTMWQGTPTNRSNLVPVVSRSAPSGVCGHDATAPGRADNWPDAGNSTNVGAIAGGVAGGVALAGLLAGAFLLLRRRQQSKAAGISERNSVPELSSPAIGYYCGPPQEVHGTNIYQNHGNPVELKGEGFLVQSAPRQVSESPVDEWDADSGERTPVVYELGDRPQRRGMPG